MATVEGGLWKPSLLRAVALADAVGVACWLLAVRSGHPDQVWPVVALPALTWVYMRFPEGFWRGGEQPGTMLTVASLAFGAATLFLFTRYIPIWQGPRPAFLTVPVWFWWFAAGVGVVRGWVAYLRDKVS